MTILFDVDEGVECPERFRNIIEDIISFSVDYVECPFECEVSVTITNNETIQTINKENRGIDSPTDVLSFPLVDFKSPCDFTELEDDENPAIFPYFNFDSGELILGDIVISIDKVMSQAKEYNHSPAREIAFLTAHSMLHLFGHDHINDEERKVMEDLQDDILNQKGYTRDYV